MEYKGPFHGFLTEADREYLEGSKDVENDAERGIRSRIRKRTLNGLLDFELLFEELDEADWKLLFEEPEPTELHRESTRMEERAASVIAFLFTGIRNYAECGMEDVLTEGIRRAEWTQRRKVRRAALDIQYSETPTDEAMRKLDEGETLSASERERLLEKMQLIEQLGALEDEFPVGPTATLDDDEDSPSPEE
jgi:hypothetical protein